MVTLLISNPFLAIIAVIAVVLAILLVLATAPDQVRSLDERDESGCLLAFDHWIDALVRFWTKLRWSLGVLFKMTLVACAFLVFTWMVSSYRGPNRDGGASFPHHRNGDASFIAREQARP